MARSIKYYLDENVHRYKALAKALRWRGVDVQTVLDANLRTASDETQFDHAQNKRRVIFTHDDDLLTIASQATHAGIVFTKPDKHSMGMIIQFLELIWETIDASEMHDHVEYF